MITPKITALFKFIEYLNSNIEYYKTYLHDIKRHDDLGAKKRQLDPRKSYQERKQYDSIKSEQKELGLYLENNLTKPIIEKGLELGVYYNDTKGIETFNFNSEIVDLKTNFIDENVQTILHYSEKFKFIFEQKEIYNFLLLRFLIEIENSLKELFSYFDESLKELFYPPTVKVIQVSPPSKLKKRIQEQHAAFHFFQIVVIADLEYGGKIYNNLEQRNNDSILTTENWEQHKETFFNQRMATYKESYTLEEKIKLELETLQKLPISETDYQILKDRYKAYLEQKQALPRKQIGESPFSIFEWATIFYYGDETKLLSENRTIKKRMEQFIEKHQIDTTLKYFRTQYYEAKKRINEKNDYPINKLKLIIPFLNENYNQTVTKVENDIIFLEENKAEY